jgi:hypothetical protein
VSICVHALPSSHALPSALAGFEHCPVVGSQLPARWHWSDAVHETAVPPQAPAVHTSLVVQALPSSHALPSALAGFEHKPVVGSHVPATWHESEAVQMTGFDPTHAPDRQAFVCRHAFVPAHAAPSGLLGFEHLPVIGSHVPARWHGSDALHTTGFDPTHVPAWQVFVCKHGLVPVQVAPSGFVGFEHFPVVGSHVPGVWHASEAAHTTGFDPTHEPAWQVFVCWHASAPVHVVPSAFVGFEHLPLVGSHVPAAWH